jgi:hypothetical protein
MNKFTFLTLLLSCFSSFAQITGKITDTNKEPLSFVSVYLNKSITGTTSNDSGNYELNIKKPGDYTIVFQFLGYKTVKKNVSIQSFPYTLDVSLEDEEIMLDEFSITTNGNPANIIIRKAIESKEINTNKFEDYTSNFYSRGLFKIKNAPKKIFGRTLGDLGGGLDSTRTGIIYLSETVSEIAFQKRPKKFKEKIIASKVSGSDNGISFNRAEEVNFDFYRNAVLVAENNLVSPIADEAFSFYTYKLEGSFYDKNEKLISKIKVIPKQVGGRVFNGFIYIVEDDWAIYGIDLVANGKQVGIPIIDKLRFKQNYNYSGINDAWIKISQTIDFKFGLFGFNVNGRFSAGYSNYNFEPNLTKKTFTKEVLSFAIGATKKDANFWNQLRPVPLTNEELEDYKIKDSIKMVRESKSYLDSINKIQNKVTFLSPIIGYTFQNSFKKWSLSFDGLIEDFSFNTVQGFHSSLGVNYFKRQNDKGKWWSAGLGVSYGLSEKKARPTFYFSRKWNNISKPRFYLSGGITTAQFNGRNPIKKLDNLIRSLTRRLNYIKIYEKEFVKIGYSEEILNGFYFSSSLEYANRKPLFNTSNYSFASQSINDPYTSNNPLEPDNFTSSVFTEHKIATLNIGSTFVFGQKYLSYPDRKFNVSESKFPSLNVNYRKTFGASNSEFNADLITASLKQDVNAGNYGEFFYYIRGGVFLKNKNIAFMDNLQAKGNQMFIVTDDNRRYNFGLLEYYRFYSNNRYTEAHLEHSFNGYLLRKIPLINKLNFHLVTGVKGLFMWDKKPYSEYSIGIDNIGFGKWRVLRVDYVKSNYNGIKGDGFLFGLTF